MAVVEEANGETRRGRRLLVAEAGMSQVSFVSVFAGVLVAYGAFAVMAAIVGGVLGAFGVDDVGDYNWDTVGTAGTAVIGVALFVAYLFGGYVAGRMAFRAGLTHGILVFVLGVVVAAVIGVLVDQLAGTEAIEDNLRNVGVPTTADEWGSIGTIAGIVSLAAMLVGAIFGGIWGERWHTKLRRRAASVEYGDKVVTRDGEVIDTDDDGVVERREVVTTRDGDLVTETDDDHVVTTRDRDAVVTRDAEGEVVTTQAPVITERRDRDDL
jgi:hypothetical protein